MAEILVVDDDDTLRGLIRTLLERRNHHVTEAQNGDAGLQALSSSSFDLVITDIVMPGRGGLELIRELRARDPSIKILAMSGGGIGSVDYLDAAREAGVSGTMAKPFAPLDFLNRVTDLLTQ